METLIFDQDLKVLYVTARSFPDGIMAAHEQLHKLVPPGALRKYFGLSRPEPDSNPPGTIVYKAAAEELTPGEAEKYNCGTLLLRKGKYACLNVKDYQANLPAIDKTFKILLALPNLDTRGYCVEWYLNDRDVKCMVRLEE
ncbi:MAG: transcriptional regulator [Bacteroidota bacterium]